MGKTVSKSVDMSKVAGDITLISNGPLQTFASIDQQRGIHWCGLVESEFEVIGMEKQFLQVRDGGRFSLHLDTDGWIHVFDSLVSSFCHEFDMKMSPDDKILDFVIIDKNEVEVPKMFAILVLPRDGDSTKVFESYLLNFNNFFLDDDIRSIE